MSGELFFVVGVLLAVVAMLFGKWGALIGLGLGLFLGALNGYARGETLLCGIVAAVSFHFLFARKK